MYGRRSFVKFLMEDSDDDSVAPDPTGDAVGANNLPQVAGADAGAGGAPAQHPVWAASAGRGGGSGKGKPESMFGPISMMELEIRGRGDLDGASSTASVCGGGGKASERRSNKRKKSVREYDDDDDDGESVVNDDNDGADSSASVDMAGAAFGGAAKKSRRPCAADMSDDGVSTTSSVVRARRARAFPVTGVTCVGCALPGKIQPVIDFIAKNMSSMSELALYKMAALIYQTKVAEPAEEEGVDVPVRQLHLKHSRVIPQPHCTHATLYTDVGVGMERSARAFSAAFG